MRRTQAARRSRSRAGDWAPAIEQAAEWRLMALLLERPRAGWREEVTALGREVAAAVRRVAVEAARRASEGVYLRLLGPGGGVSPREVAYRSFEDPGQLLAAVASLYQAFAFQPRTEDPLDHIAVLTDFGGYLLLKEAFARANGDQTAAATIAAARRDFLATHLAPMAAAFAERLAAAGPSYLVEPARLLAASVPPAPAVRIPPAGPDLEDGCGGCLPG